MATVFEVMAKLSGNSSGMVSAFKQAAAAAEAYRDRVRQSTQNPIDDTAAKAKAQLSGAGVGNGFAQGFKGAMAGVGVIAATVGLGAFVKEAAEASDATDKFKATMNFAGINPAGIEAATKASKAYADQTVYDLPTIQKTMAQLASNGISNYQDLTKAAGNLNAVAGGNAETFKSVSMAMSQTAGAGKLTAENWNQLADGIPGAAGPLMKAMEQAGAYTGNFREAMEKGEITADEFNAALLKLGTKPVAVEAAKSTATFEGAIGSLQATITGGLVGALDTIKPAATGAIAGLSGALSKGFAGFGAMYKLLTTGDFNGAISDALGVEEDSKLVDVILDVREAAQSLVGPMQAGMNALKAAKDLLVTGDFNGAIGKALNVEEDSKLVGVLLTIREKVGEFFDTLKGAASGAGGAVSSAMAALGPAFSQIGTALLGALPAVGQVLASLSPLGIAFTALLPVLPILAGAAGQLGAVLAEVLAGALQVIAPILAGIVTGVANAVTWFMSLTGGAESLAAGISAFVVGLGIYKTVIFAITAATKAWAAIEAVKNAIMAVNPVTLIILGIALLIAAIVLLVQNWDNVVKFITTIWGGFVNWIKSVMDGFVSWLSGIWNSVVAGVTGWLGSMGSAISSGFNAVLSFITGVFTNIATFISGIWNGIVNWLAGGIAGIVNVVVAGFTAMSSFVTGIFTGISTFISGVWTWIFTLLTDIGAAFWAEHGAQLTGAWNFIVSIFTGILNFYIAVWTNIVNTVVGAVTWVINAVVTGFTTVYNGIVAALTAAWAFIVSIWTTVTGFLSAVMSAIGAAIAAAWAWITGIIRGALAAVWAVISSVFNTVWGFISSIFNRISGFLSGVWATITGVIRGAVSGVAAVISGWVNGAWAVISSTFQRVVGFLGGIWGNITAGVSGMVGRVGGFFSGMWGQITGALAGAGTWLLSAGRSIVQGLIDGIGQLAGSIGNAFLNMVPGWIVGPFKKALGIASPSKLFKQFGRWIVEGLIIGVQQKGASAGKAVQGVADKLTKGAQDHLKRYHALMKKARTDGKDTSFRVVADARAEKRMADQLFRAAAMVQGQVRRVNALAAQKVALAGRLKAAQKKLTDATTVRNKKAADVSKNLAGEYDLGALVGYSAKDVVVQTRLIGDRIRNFGKKIAALKKAGLSGAMLDQVQALGSTDGAIMADSLLKGGKGVIAQMNSAYAGIGTASNSAGAMVADAMYKSGIDAARGLVNGIASQIKSVDKAAKGIATTLIRRFRTELGIKSPSRVFMAAGRFLMQGLGLGVKDTAGLAVSAVEGAAKDVAGVKVALPAIVAPTVPDIASQLALPELTQTVRLNFVGTSPVEAIAALARQARVNGADATVGALDSGGYSAAALGARMGSQAAPAPQVTVNVTARVTNPFTGEEVQAIVEDVAVQVTESALTGTARAAKAKRGSAVAGW
jgi:tape measure domain-containing protein